MSTLQPLPHEVKNVVPLGSFGDNRATFPVPSKGILCVTFEIKAGHRYQTEMESAGSSKKRFLVTSPEQGMGSDQMPYTDSMMRGGRAQQTGKTQAAADSGHAYTQVIAPAGSTIFNYIWTEDLSSDTVKFHVREIPV